MGAKGVGQACIFFKSLIDISLGKDGYENLHIIKTHGPLI